MEGRAEGSIPVEISKNLWRLVYELRNISRRHRAHWSICLYRCGPTVFSLEVDKRIVFLEPYPLAGTSNENLCFHCEMPRGLASNLRKFMDSHFDKAWERSSTQEGTVVQEESHVVLLVEELRKRGLIREEQYEELKRWVEEYGKGQGEGDAKRQVC